MCRKCGEAFNTHPRKWFHEKTCGVDGSTEGNILRLGMSFLMPVVLIALSILNGNQKYFFRLLIYHHFFEWLRLGVSYLFITAGSLLKVIVRCGHGVECFLYCFFF